MAVRQQQERIQPWTTGYTNLCNCKVRAVLDDEMLYCHGYYHSVHNSTEIKLKVTYVTLVL